MTIDQRTEHSLHDLSIAKVDAHVKLVAAALPFPVELDADMGGSFTLFIDLGTRGNQDEPADTAGIDPHDDVATWWIHFPEEDRLEVSGLTIDAAPHEVAAWIAHEATKAGSPAAGRIAA